MIHERRRRAVQPTTTVKIVKEKTLGSEADRCLLLSSTLAPLLTALLPLVHRSHLGCWPHNYIAHSAHEPLPSVHMDVIHHLVGRVGRVGLHVAMEGRHHVEVPPATVHADGAADHHCTRMCRT